MIKSMTGYGKSVVALENKKITVEIKSVNGKQFDLKLRMSSIYNEKEMMLRNYLQGKLERGTVEMNISADISTDSVSNAVNIPLAKQYYNEFKTLALEVKDENCDLLSLVLRIPDVMKSERPQLDEAEWEQIFAGVESATAMMNQFRDEEGARLYADLTDRINSIEKYAEYLESFEVKRIETIKNRIKNNINEFIPQAEIDNNRFEQELIYYIEKLDITEEKVRLKSHLGYIRDVLSAEQSQGKKLAFITQEIGREINTIGSKANDAEMQKTVVAMKDELEKIKEQLNNIL